MGGYFFSGVRDVSFKKPPLTYEQKIDLLQQRGLQIDDHNRARHFLSHLNYYRLSGYWLPLEQDHATHTFKPKAHFDTALQLYFFDREFRLWVMDAIERFEVSLRAQWAYHLAHTYGPLAHLDAGLFKPPRPPRWNHGDSIRSLQQVVRRSSEIFIRHNRTAYPELSLPPIWVICEIMTFGELSLWYANLVKSRDRNAISRIYDIDEVIFTSFLQHITTVRNICAHHSRLWNREFTISWALPKARPTHVLPTLNRAEPRKIYNTLVMLGHLMDIVNPGHKWRERLGDLLTHHPAVTPPAMGFPKDWKEL